jgi:hypothetical protein
MQCFYHPEKEAVATCVVCGKAICASCAVDVSGRTTCQHCLSLGQAPAVPAKPTNTLAYLSLIAGVVGLFGCCCYGLPSSLFGAVAAVMGYLARNQIRQSQGQQQGEQLATAGMILGLVEFVVSVLFIVLMLVLYGLSFFTQLLSQR